VTLGTSRAILHLHCILLLCACIVSDTGGLKVRVMVRAEVDVVQDEGCSAARAQSNQRSATRRAYRAALTYCMPHEAGLASRCFIIYKCASAFQVDVILG
jgi:uncharacterized MAPEG superfamily protein